MTRPAWSSMAEDLVREMYWPQPALQAGDLDERRDARRESRDDGGDRADQLKPRPRSL